MFSAAVNVNVSVLPVLLVATPVGVTVHIPDPSAASAGVGLRTGTASAAINTRAVITVINLLFVLIFVSPPFLIFAFQRFLKNRWYYLHLRSSLLPIFPPLTNKKNQPKGRFRY